MSSFDSGLLGGEEARPTASPSTPLRAGSLALRLRRRSNLKPRLHDPAVSPDGTLWVTEQKPIKLVSHSVGDQTLLLALIEHRFLTIDDVRLHLTSRDQFPNPAEDLFDFNHSPSLNEPKAAPPATDCTPQKIAYPKLDSEKRKHLQAAASRCSFAVLEFPELR